MAELGFVLVLALLCGGAAGYLGRSESDWDSLRTALALAACVLGFVIVRFGGVFDASLRARALLAVGGVVVGIGAALLSAEVREKISAVTPAATAAPLAVVAAVVALLLMAVTRANALAAAATLMFAFALGAALGTLLGSRAGDPFPLLSLATATATYGCVTIAVRNAALYRDFHRSALVALGPLCPLLAAIALAVGTRAVRNDEGESDDAGVLRGFAVATTVGTLGVVAASHWWARPVGRGGWLTLPAIAAGVGSVVVLLLGRYYDDPTMRAGRAIARARRGGPITKRRVGARIGAEGALVVMGVSACVAFAAARAADVLMMDSAALLGLAIAIAASLASFAFLDALAAGQQARTLAHDLLLVALCTVALIAHELVALLAAAIVIALVLGGVLERVAAASDEDADELRRRAAIMPVLAAGILAAAATLGSVLGES